MKWSFNNNSCHNAYPQGECVAMHMNAKNGGKQYCMTDPCGKEKVHKIVDNEGLLKDLFKF